MVSITNNGLTSVPLIQILWRWSIQILAYIGYDTLDAYTFVGLFRQHHHHHPNEWIWYLGQYNGFIVFDVLITVSPSPSSSSSWKAL